MAFRKGQLSIDFYISVIAFIGIVSYLLFQLYQTVPLNIKALETESLRSDTYQLSEILVNDPGHPVDWETKPLAGIQRIGLLDPAKNLNNYLSQAKIDRLKTICDASYNDVKNLLGIEYESSITVKDIVSGIAWVCRSPETPTKNNFKITRIVSVGGTTPAEITIEVWRR